MTRTSLIAVVIIASSLSFAAPVLAQRSGTGQTRSTYRGGDRSATVTGPTGVPHPPVARGPRPLMPIPGARDIWTWPLAWWALAPADVPAARSPLDDHQNDVPVRSAPPAPRPAAEPSLIRPMLAVQPPPAPKSARGYLQIEVEPRSAQVYIDGFYVGTVQDARRTPEGLNVAAGWHRVEFRAPGFETPAINLTIEANRTLNYQGALTPIRP